MASSSIVNAPPPDPGTAQAIAFQMLPSFGFTPQSTEYSCLNSIWTRESGWRWSAENASGAYGIPQALPGDKMASAGADWQTNPATQIKWGLGYIKEQVRDPLLRVVVLAGERLLLSQITARTRPSLCVVSLPIRYGEKAKLAVGSRPCFVPMVSTGHRP